MKFVGGTNNCSGGWQVEPGWNQQRDVTIASNPRNALSRPQSTTLFVSINGIRLGQGSQHVIMATFLTTAPGIDGDNDITNSPLEKLTPREREVLTLIGKGMSLMDIATRLHRGYATIKSHRLMLGRKLGVTNRVELARIAIQTGLSPLENLPGSGDMKTADASLVSNVDAEKALLSIEKGIAHKSGAAYFAALVEHLAKALHVKCVFLGRLLDPHSTIIRSIAVWLDNSPAETFEFDFKGTPCEKVIR